MIISRLTDLKANEAIITDISAIKQTNLWTNLVHSKGRIYNGFLLLTKGNCTFTYQDETINLIPGGLIYLPKGIKHSVFAPEKSAEFYRINFTLRKIESNEEVIFFDRPTVVCEKSPSFIFELCEQMRLATTREDSGFERLSLLCRLLDHCIKSVYGAIKTRISPAVEYINRHYTENFAVEELAKLAYMSEAQLFRLFKKELGLSPIEYKNELRIKKAEELLFDPECTVGEISSILGFENACYFSRLFKKRRGISPADYKKNF